MKNLAIWEFAFSLVAAFDEFFFWLTKKDGQKDIYIYELKKLISLVYNINYYLIVPIDRAPQRLYSERYSYRWRNNQFNKSICILIWRKTHNVFQNSLEL